MSSEVHGPLQKRYSCLLLYSWSLRLATSSWLPQTARAYGVYHGAAVTLQLKFNPRGHQLALDWPIDLGFSQSTHFTRAKVKRGISSYFTLLLPCSGSLWKIATKTREMAQWLRTCCACSRLKFSTPHPFKLVLHCLKLQVQGLWCPLLDSACTRHTRHICRLNTLCAGGKTRCGDSQL